MSHLPRNNQYELFTYSRKTYSFDDPTLGHPAKSNPPPEMFAWLREQPGCRAMDETNTAFYLDPDTYLVWKLKWLSDCDNNEHH